MGRTERYSSYCCHGDLPLNECIHGTWPDGSYITVLVGGAAGAELEIQKKKKEKIE